jgi:flagellar motor switch/type III secretory pathway protein FliN
MTETTTETATETAIPGETNAESPVTAQIALPEGSVPVCWMNRIEQHPSWLSLARVPETLTAAIPLRRFTVRSLLLLEKGQIVASDSLLSEDVPVKVGTVQIAWGEFEVVEHMIAVRVTRVA